VAKTFADRLRAARELRELSQAQLAEKAKLPVTSISHFEGDSRKPSFDNLRNLAVALEVSTDYLLGLEDSPQKAVADDPLYRHGHNLTGRDREIAQQMMEFLSKKGKG
jgi:transcriptional regulator with XRE-family HTH domain